MQREGREKNQNGRQRNPVPGESVWDDHLSLVAWRLHRIGAAVPGSQRYNLVRGALPCQCHFAPVCHLSGDTSQCLANTVLLGDRECCLMDHQFLLGPLALGRVSSDDRAVALQ